MQSCGVGLDSHSDAALCVRPQDTGGKRGRIGVGMDASGRLTAAGDGGTEVARDGRAHPADGRDPAGRALRRGAGRGPCSIAR